jgi:hypothetical protein
MVVNIARKPMQGGTVAANVIAHGTGPLNIDATRIISQDNDSEILYMELKQLSLHTVGSRITLDNLAKLNWSADRIREAMTVLYGVVYQPDSLEWLVQYPISGVGRWTANVILEHTPVCTVDACVEVCPVRLLDQEAGIRTTGTKSPKVASGMGYQGSRTPYVIKARAFNAGVASRFFKQIKC